MTPAVPPPEPSTQQRLIELADYLARVVAAVGGLWVFVEKVAKPYSEWRKKREDERRKALALEIRDILKPELEQLAQLPACTERIEVVLLRQSALFEDIDAFLHIAGSNTDRLDEVNDLMDAVGFTSGDRRVDDERRVEVQRMLGSVRGRQTQRRRAVADELALFRDAEQEGPR